MGSSVQRRSLNYLTDGCNDDSVRQLACFICGCLHTQTPGPRSRIEFRLANKWLDAFSEESLLQIFGFAKWLELYGAKKVGFGPEDERPSHRVLQEFATPAEQWHIFMDSVKKQKRTKLFGCAEDLHCLHHPVGRSRNILCNRCELPFCREPVDGTIWHSP